MKLHKFDLGALLSAIIGVAALADVGAFKEYLATLVGAQDAGTIVATLGIAGLVASQVLRVVGAPSGGGAPIPPQSAAPAPQENPKQ